MADSDTKNTCRIGTRGSDLARIQTEAVLRKLKNHHPDLNFEVVVRKTEGDRFQNRSIHEISGKGFFTKDLDEAVINGEVDAAVHSAKDVPTDVPGGLCTVACPERLSPEDVLVSRDASSLDSLPEGARVGTSSLRRKAQVLHRRPDVEVVEIRGNVDTRLEKLFDDRVVDALILAAAGLERIGREEVITERLSVDEHLPATGQGALLVQTRESDEELKERFRDIDNENTSFHIHLERMLVSDLEGGCRIPLGAVCTGTPEEGFRIAGMVASHDGGRRIMERASFSRKEKGEEAVREIADRLRENGAAELIEDARSHLES